jgi:hypothetical protein
MLAGWGGAGFFVFGADLPSRRFVAQDGGLLDSRNAVAESRWGPQSWLLVGPRRSVFSEYDISNLRSVEFQIKPAGGTRISGKTMLFHGSSVARVLPSRDVRRMQASREDQADVIEIVVVAVLVTGSHFAILLSSQVLTFPGKTGRFSP